MRLAFSLTTLIFALSVSVQGQGCLNSQLTTCLSSAKPTPTTPGGVAGPCTNRQCSCEVKSRSFACYRTYCPENTAAPSLNSQIAQSCADVFATASDSGSGSIGSNGGGVGGGGVGGGGVGPPPRPATTTTATASVSVSVTVTGTGQTNIRGLPTSTTTASVATVSSSAGGHVAKHRPAGMVAGLLGLIARL